MEEIVSYADGVRQQVKHHSSLFPRRSSATIHSATKYQLALHRIIGATRYESGAVPAEIALIKWERKERIKAPVTTVVTLVVGPRAIRHCQREQD
jgi:hypothetical protein